MAQTDDGIIAYGYIRSRFAQKCTIKEIIQIITDYYRIDCGLLYAFGSNQDGRLGLGNGKETHIKNPMQVLLDGNVKCADVASSYYHSLAVDTFGNVYVFGAGKYFVPKALNFQQRAVSVATGQFHALILAESGKVFSFGLFLRKKALAAFEFGQLGRRTENTEMNYTAKCIESIAQHRIVQVSSGLFHSFALSKEGKLFSWGKNFDGQCGIDDDGQKIIRVPKRINLYDGNQENELRASYVDCGGDSSFIIAENGIVYAFGDTHPFRDNLCSDEVMKELRNHKILDIATGGRHVLCIDEYGVVYSWGYGYGHLLGHGNKQNASVPKAIQYFLDNGIRGKWCFADHTHSAVISDDDRLFSFGNNAFYQINSQYGEIELPTEIMIGESIGKVECGDRCTFVITGNRKRK